MDKTTKRDLERFRNAIAGMAVTFRQEASEALFSGYWMGLSDLPIEAVEQAVVRGIRECKFMPSAAELRELAGQIGPEHRAVLAWSVLRKAINRPGCYATVQFDDPILTATVRAFGGWPEIDELIGNTPEAQVEGILRKRFVETYTALLARGVPEQQTRPLPGLHERHNRPAGYLKHIPEPVQIACDLPALPVDRINRIPEHMQPLLDCVKSP